MHPYIVEFLGTFFLMAVILYSKGNWILIGLALGIAVLLGGKASGGCFNPAVTIGACMTKSLPYSKLFPYIIAEIIGAVIAVLLYLASKKYLANI